MTHSIRFARLALLTTAAVALAAPLAAQGANRPTVAIMSFNNNVFNPSARDYDGLSKGVSDFLVTEMASNPNIRVIDRDQVQKLIDEQKLSTNGQIDRATAIRVGKLLGAQHMIFGGFMADANNNFRIDARAVNVETGEIEYTDRVQDKTDSIMPLIAHLAAQMNAGMHLPAMSARSSEVAPAATQRLGSTNEAGSPAVKLPMRYAVMYGKALDLSDKGEKARAIELYGAVLKDFPDFTPARSGLSKLQSGS